MCQFSDPFSLLFPILNLSLLESVPGMSEVLRGRWWIYDLAKVRTEHLMWGNKKFKRFSTILKGNCPKVDLSDPNKSKSMQRSSEIHLCRLTSGLDKFRIKSESSIITSERDTLISSSSLPSPYWSSAALPPDTGAHSHIHTTQYRVHIFILLNK